MSDNLTEWEQSTREAHLNCGCESSDTIQRLLDTISQLRARVAELDDAVKRRNPMDTNWLSEHPACAHTKVEYEKVPLGSNRMFDSRLHGPILI
jgi:hypothetical protein